MGGRLGGLRWDVCVRAFWDVCWDVCWGGSWRVQAAICPFPSAAPQLQPPHLSCGARSPYAEASPSSKQGGRLNITRLGGIPPADSLQQVRLGFGWGAGGLGDRRQAGFAVAANPSPLPPPPPPPPTTTTTTNHHTPTPTRVAAGPPWLRYSPQGVPRHWRGCTVDQAPTDVALSTAPAARQCPPPAVPYWRLVCPAPQTHCAFHLPAGLVFCAFLMPPLAGEGEVERNCCCP